MAPRSGKRARSAAEAAEVAEAAEAAEAEEAAEAAEGAAEAAQRREAIETARTNQQYWAGSVRDGARAIVRLALLQELLAAAPHGAATMTHYGRSVPASSAGRLQ
jgi:hypothetical protein